MALKIVLWLLLPAAMFSKTFSQSLQPIGQWREHLPWQQSQFVYGNSNTIVAATPYSFFKVDKANGEFERFSKINGLHETGLTAFTTDINLKYAVIGYSNSNIDVVENDKVFNIPALKNKIINADKAIYNAFIYQTNAYLSTGFGIVVIDLIKKEIKDTYIIGSNGHYVKVNSCSSDGTYLYAATTEGLKRTALQNNNLTDYRNWQLLSATNGLPAGNAKQVVQANNTVVQVDNILHVLSNNQWNVLYQSNWNIANISFSNNQLLVCENNGTTGRIILLSTNGSIINTIQQAGITVNPQQAIYSGSEIWLADLQTGLWRYSNNNSHSYNPNSPLSVVSGGIHASNYSIIATAGAVNSNWQPTANNNCFFVLKDDEWKNYNSTNTASLKGINDIFTVAKANNNDTYWMGSYGGGLIKFDNGNTTVFRENAGVNAAVFDTGSYRVSGICVDEEDNIWYSNYGAANYIGVLKKDGSYKKFTAPFLITENAVAQIIADEYNNKWIVSPKLNGLICFNSGNNIDNPGDDQWRLFKAGQGIGNLPTNDVRCIAKDKNGFIWIGTNKGIGIFQCASEAFNTSCEIVLPIVQQGRFAGYLFSDEVVNTITVDGANRKWIGTNNGLWLLDADGQKIIYRFDEINSPLFSNIVLQLSINGSTGELFIATDKGLCSFRSTATEGGTKNENVLVFPNPVPPSYDGTIAIKGLVNNAIVKITELNGRLVYQTRALGGQAVWNGRDYKGNKPATGVYLVLVSNDGRNENIVTKIVFVK